MANELDNPIFNFGIQDTMEMGMGAPELINDLLSPETATADTEKLEEIVKEKEPIIPKPSDKPAKGKEIVQKEEGKEPTGQDLIANYLGDNTEDEPEGDEPADTGVDKPDELEEKDETSQFTALSNDLFKLGVFNKTEEDEEEIVIKTPEEFLERFNLEKKRGAVNIFENFVGQFGEDYQNAFEAIFVKGVNPKEYFDTYNNVVSFIDLDLNEEANQIRVMKQSLSDQGWEAEDIADEIEKLTNFGELANAAAKHHKVLVKRQAAKLQELEAKSERELQQKAAIKRQYIDNVQQILQEKLKAKEFDGIPLNPKLVNELQDFLLVDKYKTATGETLTDFDRAFLELKKPENHATKVKIALLFKILEKDPTLSTIQRSGVTKKSEALFSEMARQKTVEKTPQRKESRSWFG